MLKKHLSRIFLAAAVAAVLFFTAFSGCTGTQPQAHGSCQENCGKQAEMPIAE
ncbi:MAG: hypothetical protein FWE62_02550 [Firmicutes bacterium]|nr:hypothetical protein [Bacillota bacterium]